MTFVHSLDRCGARLENEKIGSLIYYFSSTVLSVAFQQRPLTSSLFVLGYGNFGSGTACHNSGSCRSHRNLEISIQEISNGRNAILDSGPIGIESHWRLWPRYRPSGNYYDRQVGDR